MHAAFITSDLLTCGKTHVLVLLYLLTLQMKPRTDDALKDVLNSSDISLKVTTNLKRLSLVCRSIISII